MYRSFLRICLLGSYLLSCSIPLMAQDETAKNLEKEQEILQAEQAKAALPKPLSVGDPAPALDIQHWIQDGDGQFGKVTKFDPGKVYVVEFWATWCGPCISSMPHIAEIQKQYAKDGVQFISVTDEKRNIVEKFLQREIDTTQASNAPKTYQELTKSYCLTSDPDGSVNRDYMEAANQNGIPCAFLVGKKGEVEWIGHPMSIDEPLQLVIQDKWDREAFTRQYEQQQQVTEVLTQVGRKMRSSDVDGAVAVLDDYLANGALDDAKIRFRSIKLQVLASSSQHKDNAADYALELLASDTHDSASANDLAWSLYELADAGDFEDQNVLEAALELATKKSADAGELKPYILDTVAHLQHLTGKHKEALKTQKRAVRIAKEAEKDEFNEFLDELNTFHQKYGVKPAENE